MKRVDFNTEIMTCSLNQIIMLNICEIHAGNLVSRYAKHHETVFVPKIPLGPNYESMFWLGEIKQLLLHVNGIGFYNTISNLFNNL